MTERERLIDMLAHIGNMRIMRHGLGECADYMLANGVIMPPCKVGDTVYFPMETNGECEPYVDVGTVFAIGIDKRHTMWISVSYESGLRYYHTSDGFGKTVFLTRWEAEKALAERGKT